MGIMFIYSQTAFRKIFRFFEVFQPGGLRGLFVPSGHGVFPAGRPSKRRSTAPARQSHSVFLLARPPKKLWRTPCPLEQTMLFSSLPAGKTSEGENGAKFPRWGNFASSKYHRAGKRNNQGISLVAVIIVMVLVAAFALLLASFMSSGNISALAEMQSEQALYIATAGMECYLELLEADTDWSTPPTVFTNEAFGAGTFTVTYANQSTDSIDITSTGKVAGWDGNNAQRAITQHAEKASGGGTTFADFALFYGGGDGTITTDIKKNETITGDIFIKGDLDIGKNCTITGDVSATGEIDVGSGTNISGVTTPYADQTVTQPAITTTYYDDLISDASGQPAGDREFESETISGIEYVNGDAIIRDYINGSGTIVVTGSVDIKAYTDIGDDITIISGDTLLMRKDGTVGESVTFYSSSYIQLNTGIVLGSGAGAGEGVVLLSPGDISLGNNTTITGFVFGNDITIGTNLDLTGNLSGNRLISLGQGAVITKNSTKVDYGSVQGLNTGSSAAITTSLWQELL